MSGQKSFRFQICWQVCHPRFTNQNIKFHVFIENIVNESVIEAKNCRHLTFSFRYLHSTLQWQEHPSSSSSRIGYSSWLSLNWLQTPLAFHFLLNVINFNLMPLNLETLEYLLWQLEIRFFPKTHAPDVHVCFCNHNSQGRIWLV